MQAVNAGNEDKGYWDRFKESDAGQIFLCNWIREIPSTIEDGHSWSKVSEGDKFFLKYNATGDLYKIDSNGGAIIKNGALAAAAPFYFTTAFVTHLTSTLYSNANVLKNTVQKYLKNKNEPTFKIREFIGREWNNFSVEGGAKQILKNGLCLAPFIFSHVMGLPVWKTMAASYFVYSCYAPLNMRAYLNRLEAWRLPEGIRPLTNREVVNLSLLETLRAVGKGSYSLSQIFNISARRKAEEQGSPQNSNNEVENKKEK